MGYADTSEATYPIRAVDRVCDILDTLQEATDGASLTTVADKTQLPKSSVLRYLSALESRKYVERDGDSGMYRLGLAFRPSQTRLVDIMRDVAHPYLVRLRDRFEETINLGILDRADIFYVDVAESNRPVRLAARPGYRASLHSSANGKAIATMLPEQRVREILDQSGMPRLTADTITDIDEFLADVKRSAERGYGLDDCESQPDGRCLAVPLVGAPLPAAVSLSAPASRLSPEDVPRVAHQLRKAITELTQRLTSIPTDS